MQQDPPALALILSDVADAVRRAYHEGHRVGMQDARERMTLALVGGGSASSLPNTQGAFNVPPSSPGGSGVLSEDRRIGYGTVITSLRRAIVSAPDLGLSKDQLMQFCFQNGVDVSPEQFKDSMKRLVNNKEVRRIHLAYYQGPKMRLDLIPLDTPGLNQAIEVETKGSDIKDATQAAASGLFG